MSAAVGLRIKRRGGEVSCSRIIFRVRFLVNEKGSDVRVFVDGHQTVSAKFLVLRVVLQGHVRLEEPIEQLFLLVLGAYAAQRSC